MDIHSLNAANQATRLNALGVGLSQQAEEVTATQPKKEAAATKSSNEADFSGVRSQISDKARLLSQAVMFARQVPRESVDTDKVSHFKAILEAGGPAALLAQFDSQSVAESLLGDSATRRFLTV
ncbi:MAG: hypothetical protein U0003_05270 [Vampirovibrionales bacterium]